MKMNKFINSLLIIIVSLILVSCQNNSYKNNKTMPEIKVAFAQSGHPNPWMIALTESMEKEAIKRGVKYYYSNANDKIDNHVNNILEMINNDVDFIVIAPLENTGLEEALEAAYNANIPVILVGRTTAGKYVTTVYSDQAWEGQRCADLIAQYVKEDANVVEIRGIEGTSSVEGRERGFREMIDEKYTNMNIIGQKTANFSKIQGKLAMSELIDELGVENIDAVYAHNDEMGLGAIQAIKDAGLIPGKDISVVSIDGQKEALDAIVNEELIGSVQCSPLLGEIVFDVIQKILDGEDLTSETTVPDKIFTIENAADSYRYTF